VSTGRYTLELHFRLRFVFKMSTGFWKKNLIFICDCVANGAKFLGYLLKDFTYFSDKEMRPSMATT
jgi:hypothetical protein